MDIQEELLRLDGAASVEYPAEKIRQVFEEYLRLQGKWVEALGWAYADCCATLDNGGDPRKTEMPDVLERATKDLS
ncbi:MAG: hypothetical protein IME93_03100 [Proteobacteria bacterium]|nr:hypothetical protein [Pseudomonadota bacterium]